MTVTYFISALNSFEPRPKKENKETTASMIQHETASSRSLGSVNEKEVSFENAAMTSLIEYLVSKGAHILEMSYKKGSEL